MSAFWIAVLIGTSAIALFSWQFSIRARRYHGVARFFAFESVLILFLLNGKVWFRNPWSFPHVLSWLFLVASIPPALGGAVVLIKAGRPQGQMENTTCLVTSGIYKWIRHPMYASVAAFGLGVYFKHITGTASILAAVLLLSVVATAFVEEGELRAKFGPAYAAYAKTTKRFMPFVF